MFEPISAIVVAAISCFLAILFCLFVIVMFYDQISCIVENLSTIDKLKIKRARQQGKKVDPED